MSDSKKILCVCRGGKVRSVALAALLSEMGHNAHSCGLRHKMAIQIAGRWADHVLVVNYPDSLPDRVQKLCGREVTIVPTGVDIWLDPRNPDLNSLLRQWLETGSWQNGET